MFVGAWVGNVNNTMLTNALTPILKEIGTFLTSIFGDNQMTDLGTVLANTTDLGSSYVGVPNYVILVSLILALITSIGIVVMAVKGIKRVFSVFFAPIR